MDVNIAVRAIVVPLSPFYKLAGSLMAPAGNAVNRVNHSCHGDGDGLKKCHSKYVANTGPQRR